MFLVLVLFVGGGLLLLLVDENRAMDAARASRASPQRT